MPQHKDRDITVSPETNEQIQPILDNIHTIAQNLHESSNETQARAALTEINALPAAIQMALLKALSKQQATDAADVLLAINELNNDKIIRKEARRSLIRMEEAKIQPRWQPPVSQAPVVSVAAPNPPRYWKGFVTQSREEGEVQVVLCWEQGFEHGEARMLTFLLDFWEQGLKDFIIEDSTKRNIDTRIQQIKAKLPDITLADCTLAEGRRLIEEALDVNKWRGTTPHEEYRRHLPTIRQLILNAEDAGVDRGDTFINPTLEPDELTATFIGAWALGDYGLTYDMLTRDSGLKEGASRPEWIEHHHAWAKEAKPSLFELTFVREREVSKPAIWVPTAFGAGRANTRKEIEVGWSLELHDTPLSGTLKEMPMGTTVYKETGRHWFWTSYTVVQEDGKWHLQSITDDGAKAQGLPIEELQQKRTAHDTRINELMQVPNPDNEQQRQIIEEITWRMIEALHYDDALITKLPFDRSFCEDAFSRTLSLSLTERSLVYLERMANRFAEQKGAVLRQIGVDQEGLSEYYWSRDMGERSKHFAELAENSLRESLKIEDNIAGHAILAKILLQNNHLLDEAETHLQQAKLLANNANEKAAIEVDFGNIAAHRQQLDVALQHYQQAASLDQNLPEIWFRIGFMQRNLKLYEEAKQSYERAIEQEPRDIRAYSELAVIYMTESNATKAREVVEQGLRAEPRAAQLHALLASIYQESGNLRRAEASLAEAERLNPNLEIVQAMRESLDSARKK
ncbi:MAG TPA: tetratricopeptide repeat protein [Ktedonobacteraceae bacterium]|nr:tetratricopeptide repeat protein [Ktedonobacteraceae bacterium]